MQDDAHTKAIKSLSDYENERFYMLLLADGLRESLGNFDELMEPVSFHLNWDGSCHISRLGMKFLQKKHRQIECKREKIVCRVSTNIKATVHISRAPCTSKQGAPQLDQCQLEKKSERLIGSGGWRQNAPFAQTWAARKCVEKSGFNGKKPSTWLGNPVQDEG